MKIVHLVGFIIKKFVTMHGHTNVKKKTDNKTAKFQSVTNSVPEFRKKSLVVIK